MAILESYTDSDSYLRPTVKFIIGLTNSSAQEPNSSYTGGPDNETTPEDDQQDTVGAIVTSSVFIFLSAIVLVIGLVGNSLVWFAVWRNPRMRSATNIFLVNLAVADFLVILICLPPTMAEDITGNWHLGREMCKIVKCLQKISVYVSVLTLTAISLERWLAICRPLMFRQTSVRAKRAIAIVWVISLASAVPDAISLDLHLLTGDTRVYCAPSWSEQEETIHLWVMFIVFYLVPLGIMTFTYIMVALCLWRSGFNDENDEASANVPRAQMLLRRKKAKMLIMVVALFAVCYLPVYVLFILRYTGIMEHFPIASIRPLFMASHWLCYFNSAVNPTIYNFMSCNFRREFRIACHICCRRGSTHNTIYEALRLRNFNKHRLRNELHRTSGPSINDNSCTLQTQSTGLGALASSCSSLTPPYQSSSSNLAAPTYNAACGNGSGPTLGVGFGHDVIDPSLQRRRSPSHKRKIRFQLLQKPQKDDSNYS